MDDYCDLGGFGWPVSTDSEEAQRWFDRGIIWRFAYNHEEAISCFEKTLEHDPACAMARFGIADAIDPNYNRPWILFDAKAKTEALACAFDECRAADDRTDRLSRIEGALIEALLVCYPERDPIEEQGDWDQALPRLCSGGDTNRSLLFLPHGAGGLKAALIADEPATA